MNPEVRRISPLEGYERWAPSYDATHNPVVAMDRRLGVPSLAARQGERILDVGCGTGGNLPAILTAGARVVGIDFSLAMLDVARHSAPNVDLAIVDLQFPFPFAGAVFDASLCSLVGEHLQDPEELLSELHRVTRSGGRIVFSVYHPKLAAAGIEANFRLNGVEYRLGAYQHSLEDYVTSFHRAGWRDVRYTEHTADELLARAIPSARKFVEGPILLLIRARA
jgi:SAM-dependent methyltransferase